MKKKTFYLFLLLLIISLMPLHAERGVADDNVAKKVLPSTAPSVVTVQITASGKTDHGSPELGLVVDGRLVGTGTVTANHDKDEWDELTLALPASQKPRSIGVEFLNGGDTKANARTLYISTMSVNGTSITPEDGVFQAATSDQVLVGNQKISVRGVLSWDMGRIAEKSVAPQLTQQPIVDLETTDTFSSPTTSSASSAGGGSGGSGRHGSSSSSSGSAGASSDGEVAAANSTSNPVIVAPVATPIVSTKLSNTWGLFGPHRDFFSQEQRQQILQQLGVGYVRIQSAVPPPILPPTGHDTNIIDISSYRAAGFKIFMTIFNPTAHAGATSLGDLTAFTQQVQVFLSSYPADYASVENEVDNAPYAMPASEYLNEVKAVCVASHSMNIPCTDSGMTSKMFIALLVDWYLQNNDTANAMKYKSYLTLWYGASTLGATNTPAALATALQNIGIARSRAILMGLKNAGADRVNIHWYERNNIPNVTPDVAFADQQDLIQKILTMAQSRSGLPIVGGEMGVDYLNTSDANVPTRDINMLLQAYRNYNVVPMIWWSPGANALPAFATARSLFDLNGAFYNSGLAFASFVKNATGQ